MEKLYVVVRNDLPPGLQMAQAGHALRQFTHRHPAEDRAWFYGDAQAPEEPCGPNNLIICQVPGERELQRLVLAADGVCSVAPFYEPDRGGELTASAFGRGASRLCGALPRALRES